MAKKSVFLTGATALLGEVSQATARLAAGKIVVDLVKIGPWYSGEFAESWVVKPGKAPIRATKEPKSPRPKEKTPRRPVGNIPFPATLRGSGYSSYVIGNQMTYRNVAMDLVPGRVERAAQLSAPRDWYRLYIEGGVMATSLKEAYGLAIDSPKVKGFKKNILIGPAGVLKR
mgnify:CR=1 FL=1